MSLSHAIKKLIFIAAQEATQAKEAQRKKDKHDKAAEIAGVYSDSPYISGSGYKLPTTSEREKTNHRDERERNSHRR